MKPVKFIRNIQRRAFSNSNRNSKFNLYEFMGNKTVIERENQQRGFLKQELFGADYYHYESPQYKRERFTLNIGLLVFGIVGAFVLNIHDKDTKRTINAYNQFSEDLKFDNVEFKPNK